MNRSIKSYVRACTMPVEYCGAGRSASLGPPGSRVGFVHRDLRFFNNTMDQFEKLRPVGEYLLFSEVLLECY